ncbi:unnamed protein product, partial [marine sediment metagenome]
REANRPAERRERVGTEPDESMTKTISAEPTGHG